MKDKRFFFQRGKELSFKLLLAGHLNLSYINTVNWLVQLRLPFSPPLLSWRLSRLLTFIVYYVLLVRVNQRGIVTRDGCGSTSMGVSSVNFCLHYEDRSIDLGFSCFAISYTVFNCQDSAAPKKRFFSQRLRFFVQSASHFLLKIVQL